LLTKAKSVEINGLKYSEGKVVVDEKEFDGPQFGHIRYVIISVEDEVFLVTESLITRSFHEEYNGYKVEFSPNAPVEVKRVSDLSNKWPIPVYSCKDHIIVTNRFSSNVLPYSNTM
jgi:hypothetical protein